MNNIKNIDLKKHPLASTDNTEELKLYFYRVMHDIKAPIASMVGLIRLTKMKTQDRESLAFLEEIENHFKLLEMEISSSLMNGIIPVESINSDGVDFEKMVTEVISLLTFSKKSENVHFHTSIIQRKKFNINRQLVFSILQNIIYNSMKHGCNPDQEVLNIYINIVQQNEFLKMEIKDDGRGISEKYKKQLLEKFIPGNAFLMKGNGLGLYIIKKNVDKLNGELVVHSEKNRGTKFEICIPEV
ncbi:MAG: hypothetical protein A3F72_14450 [Bacteroidetes bacterium RIFCSPLOWO2_12_FULL_35_15]|nr:MAG: hypothetical protein A3F72_14450 [Bacteroidetes bacterium RIFCSPLOWO2_12_FULL_35_15]